MHVRRPRSIPLPSHPHARPRNPSGASEEGVRGAGQGQSDLVFFGVEDGKCLGYNGVLPCLSEGELTEEKRREKSITDGKMRCRETGSEEGQERTRMINKARRRKGERGGVGIKNERGRSCRRKE